MAGAKHCVVKTYRFEPELVDGMEKVVYLTQEGNEPKYPSFTDFVSTAISRLVKQERGALESQGVVWDHLKPITKP